MKLAVLVQAVFDEEAAAFPREESATTSSSLWLLFGTTHPIFLYVHVQANLHLHVAVKHKCKGGGGCFVCTDVRFNKRLLLLPETLTCYVQNGCSVSNGTCLTLTFPPVVTADADRKHQFPHISHVMCAPSL